MKLNSNLSQKVSKSFATKFFFSTWEHSYWFLERGGERERHWQVASHTCVHSRTGLNLQPRHVSWLGIEPVTFQLMGWWSNQLSHTGQGCSEVLTDELRRLMKSFNVSSTVLVDVVRVKATEEIWHDPCPLRTQCLVELKLIPLR